MAAVREQVADGHDIDVWMVLKAELCAETTDAVRNAIQLAFVDAFRAVAMLCAAAVWLSALLAAMMMKVPALPR